MELTKRKHAQVYISIELNDQYFILNTDSSGTWPPPEEQIIPDDYQALTSTKLRQETIFKKSLEYSDICGANVHTIIYINNRYFTLYTNGKPPPSAEQLVWLYISYLMLQLTSNRHIGTPFQYTYRRRTIEGERRIRAIL
ncbi:hypothetical protein AJ80_09707 [Polytolypa hystricis UAMH7299]|uniref:Uncharacterized protein n=1 Tax=Polytolypa hystricis (strain UAMH7299) TaxID=1447883 RepID=A0A2B7WLE4_POLH7|nr:hypothetical protein AJ80_09707 [Polytolypa hystricis UAMH7299]